MDYELVALGGATAAPTYEGEKKPPIGGSAILLKVGEWGLMNDCGAYQAYGKARKAETESIISDYRDIGGYRLPIVDTSRLIRENNTLLPSRSDSILPDFSQIYGIKHLIVVLGHVHHDHVAGYPVFRKMLAGKNIEPIVFCTEETFGMAKSVWREQQRMMRDRGQRPGYDERMLRYLCKEIRIVRPGQRLSVGPFTLSFLPAGHIVGAISTLVAISPMNKKVFFTSDISFRDQYTVKGAPKYTADDFGGIDTLVTEFTYGERDVKDRKEEIRRMIRDVMKTLESGGKVLLTALSIGRSAEVFRAIEEAGITRRYKVYVVGASANMSNNYVNHGAMSSSVRRHFVRSYNEHIGIMKSYGPCVVIASAGMLTGGWAVSYAKEWIENPKNLIALTCFQAKDTPGLRLLQTPVGKVITFDDKKVFLRARVVKYALSAHASGKEIREMIARLRPQKTFLVHGEEEQMDRFIGSSGTNAVKMIVGKRYSI